MKTGATFSNDRKQRFVLWRTWDESRLKVMVIGLNPSTANESDNDATIKSAIGIAKFNGYGGLIMVNLFSYISTEPRNLNFLRLDSPVMRENLECINAMEAEWNPDILFAWGNFAQAKTEVGENMVNNYGHKALCYAQLKDGSPRHLLYCKHKHKLIKFFPSKYLIDC